MKRNTHSVATATWSPSGRTRRHHVAPAVTGMQDQQGVVTMGISSAASGSGQHCAPMSKRPAHFMPSDERPLPTASSSTPIPFIDGILTPLSNSFSFSDQHVMEAMDKLEGKGANGVQSPGIPQPVQASSNMALEGAAMSSQNPSSQMNPPSFNPTPDDLLLSKWNLPQKVLAQYAALGINAMFPWQAQCLSLPGVLERRCSLVYSAPTSAGKTLVAELLVIKCIFEMRKKSLFILPYVSVTHEKETYFKQLLEPVGVKVGGFHGGRSPSGGLPAVDLALCTIEKANGIVNHLLEEGKLDTVGAIVVDELHMIGDANRGYLLELLLTKVLYWCRSAGVNPLQEKNTTKMISKPGLSPQSVQIIGMSATLPNLSMVAEWLGAQLFATDFRPVPLQEMVKIGQALYEGDTKKGCLLKIRDLAGEPLGREEEDIAPLCWETVKESRSVLIFCPTKNRCENVALLLAQQLPSCREQDPAAPQVSTPDLIGVCEQLRRTQVGLDPTLEATLPHGVAFHHAGLTFDEREIVEGAFRQGKVQVLVATSTLSSGVNLPARRVIIRSPIFHGQLLNVQVYKQMVGRAGRKGVDSLGESILLCKPSEKSKAVKLLMGSLSPIKSCLGQSGGRSGGAKAGKGKQGVPSAMKRALLEVVADGAATSYVDLGAYTASTLLLKEMACSDEQVAHFHKETTNAVLSYLLENEFIRQRESEAKERDSEADQFSPNTSFYATQLGVATVASSLRPDEALVVFSELQKARWAFVLQNELHIIYQVTPVYIHEQWPNIDWYLYLRIWENLHQDMKHAAQAIGVSESFLVRATSGRVPSYTAPQQRSLMIHRRFFTALALQDLVQEVPVSSVASRYGASKGLIQSLQTSAGMYAGMVTTFCQKLGWSNLELLFSQFQSRLTFGVERELTDLVRISLLNGQRARVLYNAGYHTLASLATANPVTIEATLRNSVPFKSYKLPIDGSASSEGGLSVNWCPKLRRGLREGEAALKIVEEAQQLLSEDLNLPVSTWKSKHGATIPAAQKAEQLKAFTLSTTTAPNTDPSIGQQVKPSQPPHPQQPAYKTIHGTSPLDPPPSGDGSSEESAAKKEDVARSEVCISSASRIQRKSPRNSIHDQGVLKKLKCSPRAHTQLVAREKENKVNSSVKSLHSSEVTNVAVALKSPSFVAAQLSDSLAHKSSTPMTGGSKRPRQESKLSASGNKHGQVDPHFLISPITFTPSSNSGLVKPSTIPARSGMANGSITKSMEFSPLGMDFSLNAKALAVIDAACMEAETQGAGGPSCNALCSASSISVIAESPIGNAHRSASGMDFSTGGQARDFDESSFLNAIPPTPPHLVNHSTATGYNRIPSKLDASQDPSDHVSVIPNSPMAVNSAVSFHELSSLCATQDDESGLTIIDVTANSQLFSTFIYECMEQKNLSISVATQPVCGQDGIGLYSTAPTLPQQHGLPIQHTNLEAVGVAVCWGGRDVYYISLCDVNIVSSDSEEVSADLSIGERVQSLAKILTNRQRVVAFDVKKHMKDLAAVCGCFPLRSLLLDPKVADWMLDPDAKEKTLAKMVMFYLPDQPLLLQAGEGGEMPLATLATHGPTPRLQAAAESVLALMLMQHLEGMLQAENMLDAFMNIEMPVQVSLAKMELVGIGFLEESCKAIQSVIQARLLEIEKECYNLASHPFSLTSPEDIAQVLFIELHLPCGTDLDGRRPLRGRGAGAGRGRGRKRLQHLSTAKDVLEKIAHLHPLPSLILEWRRITNTISKVVYPLSKEAVWHSELTANRIHYTCLFHTATGRVNVAGPNLQNVPKTYRIGEESNRGSSEVPSVPFGEEERESNEEEDGNTSVCMRNVFVACRGRVLLAADYSQLELRILAHLSGDKRLREVLNSNGDVFKLIACHWLNKSVEQVTKSERQQAKSICYGMVYGIGARALAEQLKVTAEDALQFMDSFMAQFPTVKTYIEETVEFCRHNGYIATYSGRRRRLPAIHSTNPVARSQAERQAVNSSIQGSAADIVKMAMIAVDKHLASPQMRLYAGALPKKTCSGIMPTLYDSEGILVLQIHDELVFEVNEGSVSAVAHLVQQQMEGAVELSVKLPVKLQCGQTWGSLTELNL